VWECVKRNKLIYSLNYTKTLLNAVVSEFQSEM